MMNTYPGTLITISLDKIRAFDLNPRITRNPDYDEIKESIKNRGLDLPPPVTQRPGENHYIIANGGNTRLAILNELWLETHDKKYQNITCLFYPWPETQNKEQGDLHCLLGHLVENEKRGALTWIERALGVQKATEMCQHIYGSLSQTELLLKLQQDGYTISQSAYSRMIATINLLLPHIPELLYGGLPRLTAEKLLTLYSGALRVWENQYGKLSTEQQQHLPTFDDIFGMALMPFNGHLSGFVPEHIKDELAGLISQTLGIDYNIVALATDASATRRHALLGEPVPVLPEVSEQRRWQPENKPPSLTSPPASTGVTDSVEEKVPAPEEEEPETGTGNRPGDLTPCALTPVALSPPEEPASPAIEKAAPAGNYDTLWNIDPVYDNASSLAALAEQTARELAGLAGLEHLIHPSPEAGFHLAASEIPLTNEARVYWQLLSFIRGKESDAAIFWQRLILGTSTTIGLPDDCVIKVFQLIRALRRLYEKQREGVTS